MGASKDHKFWRLLIDSPLEGSQNMAIDEALLESCANEVDKKHFPTLRFYQWSQPTLSVGYNQNIHGSIHLDSCKKRRIPVVRRITGGKAVLHDKEITYSVTASFSNSPFQSSVFENYRVISEALVEGLKLLGIDALIAGEEAFSYERHGPESCFAKLSKYEVSSRGLKIVGSAQRRRRKAFIQHGSIPIHADRKLMEEIIKSEKSQNEMGFITIRESLGRETTVEELTRSLIAGFEKRLGITLQDSVLTNDEKDFVHDNIKCYLPSY